MTATLKDVRQRLFHFLTPEVAATADLTLHQLQQTVAGTYVPTQLQLEALDRRMSVNVKPPRAPTAAQIEQTYQRTGQIIGDAA